MGKDGIFFRVKKQGKVRGWGRGTGNGVGKLGQVITRKEMTAALKGDG